MNNSWNVLKRYSSLLLMAIVLGGCSDDAVVDLSKEIPSHNWSYSQKVRIPVQITDATKSYDLYMNLRHTADYKYSNIFVLVHQVSKGMKTVTERKEFQLAYPDGEWLGSGSGNLYSYQLLFKKEYRFPKNGSYTFEFEENMRDNPLKEISDVGLRVEPSK